MARTATSSDFDAVVDLVPSHHHVVSSAYAIVKRTYSVENGVLKPAIAVPLAHDVRPDSAGQLPDRLPLGSDFHIHKRASDVVVLGHAFSPHGAPATRMEICVEVGHVVKQLAVFGRRHIEWHGDGRPRIGAAESFTSMPIDSDHAYGGIDTRTPYPPMQSLLDVLDQAADHPGTYARNEHGRGYFVSPERFDGIELPNVENPNDLLTDERLVVGHPQRWGLQPMPWTLDWQPHSAFPRCLFIGQRPRFMPPPSELMEVRAGILPADFERYATVADGEPTHPSDDQVAFADRFYQEAQPDLQLGPLTLGTPVLVTGMRRDGLQLTFEIPPPPELEIVLGSEARRAEARISNLVIVPDEGRVMITYCGRAPLAKKLVQGLHSSIPLSLRIDGATVARYGERVPSANTRRQ